MPDDTIHRPLRAALLVLRITLGIFLLQWGVEKLVMPEMTIGIFSFFYGLAIPLAVAYLFGAIEIAIAICLFRTISYGAAMLLHAVTVVITWRQLIDPWGDPVNHLFIAGVPVLGAFIALFLLRHYDRGILDRD